MKKTTSKTRAPLLAREAAPPSGPPILDVGTIQALAALVEQHGLSELRLRLGGGSLVLRRGAVAAAQPIVAEAPPAPIVVAAPPAAAPPPPAPRVAEPVAPVEAAAQGQNGQLNYVKSPFVGTFYRSPGPDSPPFVEIGARVRKGQVLCIVEAMKLMNEIEAEADGVLVACMAENAQPVEYGQTLFKLSP